MWNKATPICSFYTCKFVRLYTSIYKKDLLVPQVREMIWPCSFVKYVSLTEEVYFWPHVYIFADNVINWFLFCKSCLTQSMTSTDFIFSEGVSLTKTSPSYTVLNLSHSLSEAIGYTAQRVNFLSKHEFLNYLTQNLKNLKIFILPNKTNHFW